MNILITGANGLLGRYLVDLLSNKHKIFALVKNSAKLNFKLNKNIEVIEMNLVDINNKLLPENIDMIYYLAQSNKFKEFPDGTDDMLYVNVVAPNIFAKWAINKKVKKFVYASSGGVYGNLNKIAKESVVIQASEKLGFYLNTKFSAEILLRNYAEMFETFVIVRPSFMYGVGQNPTMLMSRLIQNIKNEKNIILNSQDGIKINPIYVTDAAKALANILNIKGKHIINISGIEIVSLKELCYKIGKIVGKNPIFTINNIHQNDLITDNNMMKEKLITPMVNLSFGIEQMVNNI